MTQMNLSTKQTHRHREQTVEEGWASDVVGVWNQQM